jgi:hypothetical protein
VPGKGIRFGFFADTANTTPGQEKKELKELIFFKAKNKYQASFIQAWFMLIY